MGLTSQRNFTFKLPSFLSSTTQLRPWPPPQNTAEFLGGFSTIFFLQGRVVSPTPNPHPGGPGLITFVFVVAFTFLIVEKPPRNSTGFCGGGQGLSWAVEPRKEEEEFIVI
jgi:hypothetical protein